MNLISIYNVNHQCQSPFNWPMPVEKFQLIFHEKPVIKDMHPILPSDPYGWKTTFPSAIFYDFSCANGNDYQGHSKN
ncbi:hypothetical protein [Commensalibacter sp. ESL0382]|uniref:hypothetical protein n=1 Tax=unclassified Commensalibacter TaxID=2630218 RepID=UPI0012D87B72|nr:hypothetical protein [Commensalibacter sp. ESL0382]MUG34115.1 hypothetical protein [Commensalibacter sp. ESL0382]